MGSGSFQIQTTNLQVVDAGFTGIAVALLGRNTGFGIVLGALLFAVLHTGANNISSGLSPELAINLATIIQGVIILFVGGEVVVRWILSSGGRSRRKDEPPALDAAGADRGDAGMSARVADVADRDGRPVAPGRARRHRSSASSRSSARCRP